MDPCFTRKKGGLEAAAAHREHLSVFSAFATLPVEIVRPHLDPDHAGVSSRQSGGAEVHHRDLEVRHHVALWACL